MTVYPEPPPKFEPFGVVEHLLASLMGPVRTAYATIGDSRTAAAFVLVVGALALGTAWEAWNLPMHKAKVRQEEAYAEQAEIGAEMDRLRLEALRATLGD